LPASLAKQGKYLCIRIKGNSMSPTLQDGGYVVIRLLDRGDWKALVSDRVYVISDTEGMTYLKRVRNRFSSGGFIVLTSDNPDKASYPNQNLKEEEIVSIWYVEWYLSAKMPNVHDQFYSKLERLENNIDDINRKFADLERLELKTRK
jgi:phage repressor protein C with HTH and peptisase S24 domain